MKPLRIFQFAIWSAVLVAGTAVGTIYLMRQPGAAISGPVTAATGGVSTLGKSPYALVDTRGEPFTNDTLKGGPTALFFGFTHCPDICPTTLGDIAGWYETLGDRAANLKTYFVSIDPERDSSAVLAQYLSWNKHVTGVTGSPEQIAELARSWGVFYEKVPDESGSYAMDHTSSVYLIGADGELQTIISYQEDRASALRKLEALLGPS